MQSAVLAIIGISICPSVTCWYCVKTMQGRIIHSSLMDSVHWFFVRCSALDVADQLPLSCGHTANNFWQTKVCRVFKKLANILCWPTMFAVYELVRFFVGQQAANRAL